MNQTVRQAASWDDEATRRMVREAIRSAIAPLLSEMASLRKQIAERGRREEVRVIVVETGSLPAGTSDGAVCFRLSDRRCFLRSGGVWVSLDVT